MEYDDLTILCDMKVKLQKVDALTVRMLKSAHRVFGTLPASPTMCAIQLHRSALVEDILVKIVFSFQAGADLEEKTVGHAAIDAAT